jgi:hypothetical protein
MADTNELKPYSTIAKEFLNGEWGTGKEARERLEKAGYNYAEVYRWVNLLKK